jgi:apolipoprotein N-acyltransferase
MDFLRQAGRQRVDILLAPANDSREIDPLHSRMAAFRAIEEGFNLILHISLGLSLLTDYQGRVTGQMDHFQTADHVMVGEVPTRGVVTLYSRCGFVFPIACLIALLIVVAAAIGRRAPPETPGRPAVAG